MVTVLVPPAVIEVGENALRTEIPDWILRGALAGTGLVISWAVTSEFAGIVFVRVVVAEFAAEATVTVIVQVPAGVGGVALAGIVPPLSVTDVAVLVIVPPHCGEAGVPEIVNPAGRVSVMPTPV